MRVPVSLSHLIFVLLTALDLKITMSWHFAHFDLGSHYHEQVNQ